jgi:hypothetical protein
MDKITFNRDKRRKLGPTNELVINLNTASTALSIPVSGRGVEMAKVS